jgi:hypothetical protein
MYNYISESAVQLAVAAEKIEIGTDYSSVPTVQLVRAVKM